MAESFVSLGQFGEFSKRMDERFDAMYAHFDERFNLVDKRFDDMNLHVSQRHDDTMRAISDLRVEMRQMRQWIIAMLVTFLVGFGLLMLKEFLSN